MLKKLARLLFGKSANISAEPHDSAAADAASSAGNSSSSNKSSSNKSSSNNPGNRQRKRNQSSDSERRSNGNDTQDKSTPDDKDRADNRETKDSRRNKGSRDSGRKNQGKSAASADSDLPAELLKLDLSHATIVQREDHTISRKDISPSALKVLYRLNDAGYQGFLVGGGVRDLLLNGSPKDFDISTDATPEEVKELFRNSRVVGRRFKIAHVRFGREIIEVTTFRAHHEIETEVEEGESRRHIKNLDSAHSSTGMILRDNVYGSINEDALRRDFTVNALYYTTNRFIILDFVNGLPDIEKRLIRMIGDPETRYREDPVRILRAIRLAAKLDFSIEPGTEAPIGKLAPLLVSISSARLFDETVKLFTGGKAEATFSLLRQYKVADYLFKPTLRCLADKSSATARLLQLALQNTDKRLAEGKSVTPAFLYAALLWPPLQQQLKDEYGEKSPPLTAQQSAATDVITEQLRFTAIPKRFTSVMREIWELQSRLITRNRRSVESVIAHPRFRAAYDFLLLREESGEELAGAGEWWTAFQLAERGGQDIMIEQLQTTKAPRKRRRKPRSNAESAG